VNTYAQKNIDLRPDNMAIYSELQGLDSLNSFYDLMKALSQQEEQLEKNVFVNVSLDSDSLVYSDSKDQKILLRPDIYCHSEEYGIIIAARGQTVYVGNKKIENIKELTKILTLYYKLDSSVISKLDSSVIRVHGQASITKYNIIVTGTPAPYLNKDISSIKMIALAYLKVKEKYPETPQLSLLLTVVPPPPPPPPPPRFNLLKEN